MLVPEKDLGGADFAEFVAQSLPALLRFGHVLTGNPHEAEELVQEALAKSLRRWRRIRAEDPVAYVRRVMVNTHMSQWRRWGARMQVGDVPPGSGLSWCCGTSRIFLTRRSPGCWPADPAPCAAWRRAPWRPCGH
jgi:DNA-directed RNA polymerase specialized sigma24 family protein